MEPESSLPQPQQRTTCIYPEPEQPGPWLFSHFFKISSYLRLGLSRSDFPSGLPIKPCQAPLLPHTPATCPAHLIRLDLPIQTFGYTDHTAPLYVAFPTEVTSPLFSPNILRSTVLSNTINLCSSLNVRRQVSHPCKTTGEVKFL